MTTQHKKFCSVDGCGKTSVARGYCQNHYRVFMRRGTATPPETERKVHVATGGYLFKTINKKTVYLHIEAAEKALGKPLPSGAEVHHINLNQADNRNANLVICKDHEYHSLLHMRTEALAVAGNPNFRICCVCQLFDAPSAMRSSGNRMYHAKCMAFRAKQRRAQIKRQGASK